MTLLHDTEQNIKLLRKLLDYNSEKLETILPEFHERKNNLNYLKILLLGFESDIKKEKQFNVSEKVREMVAVLLECMDDLNVIYARLNDNPAKLHGYKLTLSKLCLDYSKRYNIEVEFDNNEADIYDTPVNNNGIFSLFSYAIESICVQGHGNVYVLLHEDNDKLVLTIKGHGEKRALNLTEEYILNIKEMLQCFVAWKMPIVKPETDWQNLIDLEIKRA